MAQTKDDKSMLMKRVGQFAVNSVMIERFPDKVLALFKDVIVLQAAPDINAEVIRYIGISEHFRELVVESMMPVYVCECTEHKDGTISIKWIEQETSRIVGVGANDFVH